MACCCILVSARRTLKFRKAHDLSKPTETLYGIFVPQRDGLESAAEWRAHYNLGDTLQLWR